MRNMDGPQGLDAGDFLSAGVGGAPFGAPGPSSAVLSREQAQREDAISQRATDPVMERVKGGRGFRTVLRNRYFLRLWAAQLVSQTIMNAANYGLITLVASQTKSVLGTAGAIVAFALPAALFGAPAGVLVDRLDRHFVLWMSNALRAAASVGFVLTLMVDSKAFVPVLLLSFFMATVGQFFAPAEGAAIPALVYPEELMNALALFNITFTLAQALGLIILAPAIILFVPAFHVGTASHGLTVTSTESLFIIVAALYVACALLILSIPRQRLRIRHLRPGREQPPASRHLASIWAGIVESWRFVRRDRRLVQAVFQLCLGGTVIAIVATIAPTFVLSFFNRSAQYAALVFFPAGVGLVIGSALVPELAKRMQYARTVAIGIITLGLCAVVLPFTREVAISVLGEGWWYSWLYLGIAMLLVFLVGVALDLINVPAQTLLQERSPDWIKGRVLALQGMVLNAVTVPAVLIIGWVADRFGLSFALEALAIVIVVAGLASVRVATRERP